MKTYKIKAVVGADEAARVAEIRRLIVDARLALSPGRAAELVRRSIDDADLRNAYYVAVASYNFGTSPATNLRLMQMAAAGLLVIVGCSRIPREMEFMSDIYYV